MLTKTKSNRFNRSDGDLDTLNTILRFVFNPEIKHIYFRELRETMCIHDGDQEVQKSSFHELG